MKNTYVISWRSKSEPRSGRSKKLLTREDAEALAYQLNCDHPLFFHQALNVANDDLDLTFAAAATEVPQATFALV